MFIITKLIKENKLLQILRRLQFDLKICKYRMNLLGGCTIAMIEDPQEYFEIMNNELITRHQIARIKKMIIDLNE